MDFRSQHEFAPFRRAKSKRWKGCSVVATLRDDQVSKFHRSLTQKFPHRPPAAASKSSCRPVTTKKLSSLALNTPPLPVSPASWDTPSPSSSGGYAGHSPYDFSPFQLVPSPRSLSPNDGPCHSLQPAAISQHEDCLPLIHDLSYETSLSHPSSRSHLVAGGHQ